jgi:hypothetical protein
MMNFIEYVKYLKDKKENEAIFIIEGINIDDKNRLVSVDLTHENNVDTSITLNPTYSKVKRYDVISLFKRKHNSDNTDGNPLVYALKDIKNWNISKKDIILLLKQFIGIAKKLNDRYDTILTIPSSNDLNNKFLYRLNRIIKCENKITDHIFSKMYTEDVVDNIDYSTLSDMEMLKMKEGLSKMGKYFTFKHIPKELRKHIRNIWDDSFSCADLGVADKINGKSILILDDTIASGQSISTFCDTILKNYTPEKVTIITLFSKL